MQTTYDMETIVQISEEFIKALHDLMRAEMQMMIAAEPENADCWTWGICTIGDLAGSKKLMFEYGGDDDKPKDMLVELLVDVMAKGPNVI